MNEIILTGGGGLLGSHVLPLLQGRTVHALGRGGSATEQEGVVHHAFDLSGAPDYSALPERADAIVYLAQSRRFREFPEGAPDMFRVNAEQVMNMCAYALRAGVKTFVYASTGGVYGASDAPLREEDPVGPAGEMGFYPTSKLLGEAVLKEFGKLLNVVILRPFFIYGAGQARTMLIPRLVDSVRNGTPIGLQGPDGMKITPVHASDAANAVVAALELQGSHVVNVAGAEVMSFRQIGEADPVTSVEDEACGGIERFPIHVPAPGGSLAEQGAPGGARLPHRPLKGTDRARSAGQHQGTSCRIFPRRPRAEPVPN